MEPHAGPARRVIDGRAVTIEIDADLCVAIYDAQIGAGRLVRRDLLESAVAAPFAGFGGCEAYPTLIEKAARLAYGIAEAQAYEDGNKRLAWLSTVVFLEINDVVVEAEQDEAAYVIRAVGTRDERDEPLLSLAGLTEWFVRCSRERSRKP